MGERAEWWRKRSWWANVYPGGKVGPKSDDAIGPYGSRRGAAFVIHVTPKPDGAPKRYASAKNRRAWEGMPFTCALAVSDGTPPEELG